MTPENNLQELSCGLRETKAKAVRKDTKMRNMVRFKKYAARPYVLHFKLSKPVTRGCVSKSVRLFST